MEKQLSLMNKGVKPILIICGGHLFRMKWRGMGHRGSVCVTGKGTDVSFYDGQPERDIIGLSEEGPSTANA